MKKFLIIAFVTIFSLANVAYSQKIENKVKLKPNLSPVQYVIAYNKIDPKLKKDDEQRRFIEILIKPRYFTEKRLTVLFQLISRRFPTPESLFIDVYTDSRDILTLKERAEGYLIVVDKQGKETLFRPTVKARSNPKASATFIRYKEGMRFIMNGSQEVEMETFKNNK